MSSLLSSVRNWFGRVAEAFGDHLRMSAGLQRDGRIPVAKVVQADVRQTCGINQSCEIAREPVGVHQSAEFVGEHQVRLVRPRRARRHFLNAPRTDTRRDERNGTCIAECDVARTFARWFSNHLPRYAATVTADRPTLIGRHRGSTKRDLRRLLRREAAFAPLAPLPRSRMTRQLDHVRPRRTMLDDRPRRYGRA